MKQEKLDDKFPGLNAAHALEVYSEHRSLAAAAKILGVSQVFCNAI